jgi:hypothetical protein
MAKKQAGRKLTSFRGAGQARSAAEVAAEKKRIQVQKITHALRKK